MEIVTKQTVLEGQNLEDLISLFNLDNFYVKKIVLENITAEKNKDSAVPLLINALKHHNYKTRVWTITALGIIKDPLTIDVLISAYHDPNPIVRRNVIEVLTEFKDSKSIPIFIKALEDTDIGVKRNAAIGLGEICSTEGVMPLFNHLFDEDTRLRCEIANSLKLIDEIFTVIFTSDIISALFIMKNVEYCKQIIFQKISTYFTKLTHYPELNSQIKKWLDEHPYAKPIISQSKIKQMRNFKLEEFRNRFTCSSVNWPIRLSEEEQQLEILLDFYRHSRANFSLVRAEFDKYNSRILNCTLQFMPFKAESPILIKFKIRIPLKYPFVPPKASDFSRLEFIERHHDVRRWDDEDPEFKGFRFACLGKLDSRWQKDGSMGIANYIQMLCYYAAFDHFAFKI